MVHSLFVCRGTVLVPTEPWTVEVAEMAVKLKRLTGLGVSRTSDYVQPPPEIIEEFMTHPKGL